ncbi:pectate lyase [Pokkaliibacter sp. MBI-7]|uniref:pectate lyase n=1 Tax=Pokkaliibacter sp. MBI-7 TaxID=3040600 RepID=UPI0024491C1F|nr:pectate lyase [Pokkaliibacter sp. MBI-7]MDH2435661.1 pectate lyase [Pokkaliibacter sp. MBI-7]
MISLEIRIPLSNDWPQSSSTGLNSGSQANAGKQPDQTGQSQGDDPLRQLVMALMQALQGLGQNQSGGNSNSSSPQDPFSSQSNSNNMLQDLGKELLNNLFSSNGNGNQLSDTTKPLSRDVGKMMDNNPQSFGNPTSPQTPAETGKGGGYSQGDTSKSDSSPASSPTTSNGESTVTNNSSTSSSTGASNVATAMFPKASSNPIVLDEPIVVKAGETFNGDGQTYTASSKLGDGGQSENQKPLFILEDGAKLENVIIGNNGADGIHTKGDAKLDKVHWTNVGEDALTMKGSGTVEISNSSAKGAADKIFQLNAPGTLKLDNVQADDFGKLVRTNGGQQGDWDIYLNNVTATNGKVNLLQSDSNAVKVHANNVKTENVKELYVIPKSGTLDIS